MKTHEDYLLQLSSGSAAERATAALALTYSEILSHREAVRQMVLSERHPLVVMCLAPSIIGWNDDTLNSLLTSSLDERALYALIEALSMSHF